MSKISKYLRKTTKWVTDVSLGLHLPHHRGRFGGILFAGLFVDLVADSRHFWSRSGTLRDLRVRERAFSTISLIFNHFRRIRRPLSGHKELDKAPRKPAAAGTPGVPKPGFFATAGGDLPTPKGAPPPAAAPSSPDYHAAPKAPLVGRILN